MSSTQPKADLRCHLSTGEARSMRPRSYVTQGHVRVRPRRYVSPRTLALPPSDWQDSWASEGHAFDIKTLVWLETGEIEIRHGLETRSQTPSKAMSIFPVGQRLLFCCILVDNKSSNCNLISDSKLCSYGSQLFEIYDKGNLTSPLTQNNQLNSATLTTPLTIQIKSSTLDSHRIISNYL